MSNLKKIIDNTSSNCKILVASIRNINEISHLASNGLTTFTINKEIAEEQFMSQETLEASKKFERDARNLYQ